MNKLIAEFVGAFTLSLVVLLTLANGFAVATPVLAALTLGVFVYTVGHLSGTHINPAVTVGLWSIKKIETVLASKYILAQVLGAGAAYVLATATFGIAPELTAASNTETMLAEMIGAILFTFGIASVVYGRAEKSMSGVVVGVSLLLGIAIAASLGSNGVLNPAVAFAIGSFNLAYLVGPILGSVIGFNLYKYLSQ